MPKRTAYAYGCAAVISLLASTFFALLALVPLSALLTDRSGDAVADRDILVFDIGFAVLFAIPGLLALWRALAVGLTDKHTSTPAVAGYADPSAGLASSVTSSLSGRYRFSDQCCACASATASSTVRVETSLYTSFATSTRVTTYSAHVPVCGPCLQRIRRDEQLAGAGALLSFLVLLVLPVPLFGCAGIFIGFILGAFFQRGVHEALTRRAQPAFFAAGGRLTFRQPTYDAAFQRSSQP